MAAPTIQIPGDGRLGVPMPANWAKDLADIGAAPGVFTPKPPYVTLDQDSRVLTVRTRRTGGVEQLLASVASAPLLLQDQLDGKPAALFAGARNDGFVPPLPLPGASFTVWGVCRPTMMTAAGSHALFGTVNTSNRCVGYHSGTNVSNQRLTFRYGGPSSLSFAELSILPDAWVFWAAAFDFVARTVAVSLNGGPWIVSAADPTFTSPSKPGEWRIANYFGGGVANAFDGLMAELPSFAPGALNLPAHADTWATLKGYIAFRYPSLGVVA